MAWFVLGLPRLHHLLPAEDEQLPRQVGGAMRGLADLQDIPVARVAGIEIAKQEGIAEDIFVHHTAIKMEGFRTLTPGEYERLLAALPRLEASVVGERRVTVGGKHRRGHPTGMNAGPPELRPCPLHHCVRGGAGDLARGELHVQPLLEFADDLHAAIRVAQLVGGQLALLHNAGEQVRIALPLLRLELEQRRARARRNLAWSSLRPGPP